MRLRCSPAYCRALADTLSWLFELPPPAGAEIRLTDRRNARSHAKSQSPARSYGKRPSHPFFGNSNSPFRYTDAPALERHINTSITDRFHYSDHRSGRTLPLGAKILDERVVMAQGDMKPPNFLIDPHPLQATIIDFGGISALPHSFLQGCIGHNPRVFDKDGFPVQKKVTSR
ncbi:uncharacterized protein EI90DRAFT_3021396 [Cantharellus anzutake]|uniref:uncharacterized protein n=1 Tax=Cantharellus anzutake TaxID=1750568 RepID=UPI0019086FC6|nr:uncharacterized protein EI90DRAFT_3021396 [Cantharellus anzutake]KAF8317265.1 hypothetical protein EI90DRAFT_3021396 [Cantharellus anzutake]